MGPRETVDMPVLFRLHPDLLKARNMRNIYDISLSYTFFLSTDQNIYWDEAKNEYTDAPKNLTSSETPTTGATADPPTPETEQTK